MRFSLATLLIALIGALVGAAVLYAHLLSSPSSTQQRSIAYWEERIARIGGEQAYDELTRTTKGANANEAHTAAHSFGEALYKVEGLPGISVCDDRFLYGCYHQFIAQAIAERGLAEVSRFGELCARESVCLHGIGHGIVAHQGYTPSALIASLAACTTLNEDNRFGGCAGGVFMEYNMRQAHSAGIRTLDPEKPYEPCNALRTDADTCYYWQADVWKLNWQGSTTPQALVKKMGALCAKIPAHERAFCMAGIGAASISLTAYDPEGLGLLCDLSASAPFDRAPCRASAGKVLAGTVSLAAGERLCAPLEEPDKARCLNYLEYPSTPATFALPR